MHLVAGAFYFVHNHAGDVKPHEIGPCALRSERRNHDVCIFKTMDLNDCFNNQK